MASLIKYARLENQIVVEIIEADIDIDKMFHPSIVAGLIPFSDDMEVEEGLFWDGASFVPLPPNEPEPVPSQRTYKSDVWRRCSETEAAALDAALAGSTAKLRRLWDDCTILEHEAPEWSLLAAGVAAVVGEERAAEILAPSVL